MNETSKTSLLAPYVLLALDPGPKQSGLVRLEAGRLVRAEVVDNENLWAVLNDAGTAWGEKARCELAIEGIASYGMPVGAETFETCIWIGRAWQMWHAATQGKNPTVIYRREVKLHLCGSPKAKDANIRQALIDRLGPPGTKKAPGGTYAVKSHAWAALALAMTAWDRLSGAAEPGELMT